MKLTPEAILFDLDGVLIDSFESWLIALNTALEMHKFEKISRKLFIDKYWGHDLFDNLKSMKIPIEVGETCNKFYGNTLDHIRLYPNTIKTLEQLKNFAKTVITNTPKDSTKKILKKFKLEPYFVLVLTSSDVSMAKPHPEIVIKTCEKLKVNPENVVLVGDTESDIKAGRSAGCKVIGLGINGDYNIKNISEITKIISI